MPIYNLINCFKSETLSLTNSQRGATCQPIPELALLSQLCCEHLLLRKKNNLQSKHPPSRSVNNLVDYVHQNSSISCFYINYTRYDNGTRKENIAWLDVEQTITEEFICLVESPPFQILTLCPNHSLR